MPQYGLQWTPGDLEWCHTLLWADLGGIVSKLAKREAPKQRSTIMVSGGCMSQNSGKTHMFNKITNLHHFGFILTKFPELGAQT